MGEKEDERLLHVLEQYAHIPINQQHKESVAATLRAFVPVSEQNPKTIFKQLFKQAMMEIWQYQKAILCILFLFLFGLYFIIPDSLDYKLLFLVTTPLPLVLMGWRMLEDYDEEMVELLLTYKFTFQQLLCAKIVAVCSIAFINYTFLAIYLIFSLQEDLLQSIFRLLITGITPILTWGLVLLIFQIYYRKQSVWGVLVLAWVFFALLVMYTPVGEWLLGIHISFYVLFNCILLILLWNLLVRTWRLERIVYD